MHLATLAAVSALFLVCHASVAGLELSADASHALHAANDAEAPCYACSAPACAKLYVTEAKPWAVWKTCAATACRVTLHISSSGNFTALTTDSVGRNSWYNGDKFVVDPRLSTLAPAPCFAAGPAPATVGDVVVVITCKSPAGCDLSYSFEVDPLPECPAVALTCPEPLYTVDTRAGLLLVVWAALALLCFASCFSCFAGFVARKASAQRKLPLPAAVEMHDLRA